MNSRAYGLAQQAISDAPSRSTIASNPERAMQRLSNAIRDLAEAIKALAEVA